MNMSLNFSPKMYKSSTLKIRDSDRIKQLIKNYANSEKINDIPKAATMLIYTGYRAWISESMKRNPTVDLVAKYQMLSTELIEALRIVLNGIKILFDEVDDDHVKKVIKNYLEYGEAVLMKAVVELEDENNE